MKDGEIVTIRRVYGTDRDPITVGPSPEVPGLVRIFTENNDAREYWGSFDFSISVAMARKLASAILACADEQEAA